MSCGGGGGSGSPGSPIALAGTAFQYGYPLTEFMRLCDAGSAVNQFAFQSALSTPANRDIVNPNNDTLYGKACVYLGDSWATITMPSANGRYMSMQVFDAYTNTVTVKGPNQIPAQGAQYVLHLAGSSTAGMPAGVPVIEVPTPYAYVFTRTFVNDPADLNAALAAQSGIQLTSNASGVPAPTPAFGGTAAQQFFQKLEYYLAKNPPPASEAPMVASFAGAGIQPTLAPSIANLSADQSTAWESAYASGLTALDNPGNTLGAIFRGGWNYQDPAKPWTSGIYGTDYASRAVIARCCIFPLPISEAFYPATTTDANFVALNGNTPRTVTLGNLPVDAKGFWSLTLTGSDGFLVSNPINRYSISNRTPGVNVNAGGSLTIVIQCTDPGDQLRANWLPAPCGPYRLTLRMYLPTAAAFNPNFTVPAVQ